MDKKTKIIATISDKHCEPEFIRALYEAGMNAARINSAHLTPEGATTIVENVRKVSEQIAIIIDTKGPEIRITGMAPGFEAGIPVSTGDIVRLRGTSEDLPSNNELIYLNDGHISRDVPGRLGNPGRRRGTGTVRPRKARRRTGLRSAQRGSHLRS